MKRLSIAWVLLLFCSLQYAQTKKNTSQPLGKVIVEKEELLQKFAYNKKGQLVYKESAIPLTSILSVWRFDINNSDYHSYAEGEIRDGYKEGKWTYYLPVIKYPEKKRAYVPAKIEHYIKGVLSGLFQVYQVAKNHETLIYSTQFIGGSGSYKDFHHKTGAIKEQGEMIRGEKEGRWEYYNDKEELIKTRYFKKGEIQE